MAPTLLSAAILAHIFPQRHSQDHPDSEADQELEDPEKGASSPSGTSPDQAFDGDNNDEGDDAEQEEVEENDDFDANEDSDRRPGQGVPLAFTETISSSSMITFSRHSLPKWLLRIKEVLFTSHQSSSSEDVSSLPNYRRIPIISGSLIPFAILLEIPGLTEHWYVRTSDRQIIETRPNPPLVIISMSFSMALAVLANIALIQRFLERHVKRNTIICIVALTLHDILNIVTVITFAVEHRFNDGFTNGEAFWMTICSTVVSTVTNLTLIWDLVTTPDFNKSGSGVTPRQRSLVVITIIFLAYIALGALISSLSMTLTFVNGLFFTIVTTLTIGFGDIVPITTGQRIIVCFYAVFGIIILGAAIRITSEAVLEGLQIGYRRRLEIYKKRRKERKEEREQVRRWRVAVEERLVERGLAVWTSDKPAVPALPNPDVRPTPQRRGSIFVAQVSHAMYLNTEALSPEELESAAREAGVPLEKFIGRKFGRRARQHPSHTHDQYHQHDQRQQQQQQQQQQRQRGKERERPGRVPLDHTWTIDDGEMQERKSGMWGGEWWERACHALRLANAGDGTSSSKEDLTGGMTYHEMMRVLEKEERRSLYTKLGLAWALFFVFWLVGSLIFSATEGWGYGSAMYFCFIAFTTIGYGDLAPETPLGRGIFVFWALFGVGAMTILISVITDALSSRYRSVTHNKKFDRAVRRYRQGQDDAMQRKVGPVGKMRKRRSSVVPALQANLHRISSREPGTSCCVPQPARTVGEAEERLRARIEPLPAMILKEVLRMRDHTRYFLLSNGHGDAISPQMGGTAPSTPKEHAVPEDLKLLLDEIAEEEGFEERLKQEVWDDVHARNTLVLLSLEKGARKMVEAAEIALETLTERDLLLVREESRGEDREVEEPVEIRNDEE